MTDERWKTIVSVVQVLLGTTLVGVFSAIINGQIQEREVEIKEQELIAKHMSTVLSKNEADRMLMAQFFATVSRSESIRLRWEAYRKELAEGIAQAKQLRLQAEQEASSTTDAKVRDQMQGEIQRIDAAITPGASPPIPGRLPARVYVHIYSEEQRPHATELARIIDAHDGRRVPGIERVAAKLNNTELRYFKPEEALEADAIADTLRKEGVAVNARFVKGYESSAKLRPRHFELWFAANWK